MNDGDRTAARSSGRQDVLDALIRGAAAAESGPPRIPRRDPGADPPPLSYAQQRLWFYAELEADLRQYHIPVSWRLEGDLDVAALRKAFDGVQERHESLRTRFVSQDSEPRQVIDAPGPAPVEFADLREAGSEEFARRVPRMIEAPFDLREGPLWRGLLAWTGEDEYRLLLVIHHIVFDGWSMGVFQRDLVALYEAARGRGAPPEPLAISYPDYAVWERDQLRAGRLDALLGYWREQMDGAPEALELRTDHPRPERFQNAGAVYDRACEPEVRKAAEALCAEEGASPFMVLFAAFGWVLARHAGVRDLVLGTVVANRSRPELEDLVGFFVNTVLLRLRLDGLVTFRDLLRHAREVVLGAFAHQELPFDALVEDLRPVRELSRAPLFQVMYTFVPEGRATGDRAGRGGQAAGRAGGGGGGAGILELPGVRVEPDDPPQQVAQFDLGLTVRERAGAYDASLAYATSLFDERTAARLVGHLFHLLGEGVRAPDARLDGVALATPQELAALRGVRGDVVALPEVTLWQAVVAQAERTPDLVALTDGQRSLSYRETVARAEVLARHLVAAGVGLDVPVGLCLQRSFEQVLGLLGVLAAGGGFLPILAGGPNPQTPGLPQTPAARVAYMLEVAGAGVCLTDRRLAGELPDGVVRYVCVDDLGPTPGVELPRGDPDALAAVYFTSGSTGEPKGVAVTNRNWLNVLTFEAGLLGLAPGEVSLYKTSITFDMMPAEVIAPLMRGASVAVGSPEAHRDPAAIVDTLARCEVTVMAIVPSLAKLVFDEIERRGERLPALRHVWTGGEALTAELAEQFWRLPGSEGRTLDNQWGPTETSVVATTQRVDRAPGAPHTIVPIGLPNDNVGLYVLDDGLHPLPPGVPGEIYVSGAQLARGYAGRPELTAERFLPDPLATEPGGRMYRTGDLGWRRDDGVVEFLGRADHQVKVRGMRVELGEIEARLESHPAVRRAVVALQDEGWLAAYVEPTQAARAGGAVPEGEALAAHLGEFLPEHMVPSTFTVVEALPLGPSGKVDRRALPDPVREGDAAGYVTPASPTEQALADIMAATLGVERVGAQDDFFALGGHSLLAAQVTARVTQRLPIELPLSAVFERPTVRGLAALVEELLVAHLQALPDEDVEAAIGNKGTDT